MKILFWLDYPWRDPRKSMKTNIEQLSSFPHRAIILWWSLLGKKASRPLREYQLFSPRTFPVLWSKSYITDIKFAIQLTDFPQSHSARLQCPGNFCIIWQSDENLSRRDRETDLREGDRDCRDCPGPSDNNQLASAWACHHNPTQPQQSESESLWQMWACVERWHDWPLSLSSGSYRHDKEQRPTAALSAEMCDW